MNKIRRYHRQRSNRKIFWYRIVSNWLDSEESREQYRTALGGKMNLLLLPLTEGRTRSQTKQLVPGPSPSRPPPKPG